MALKALISKEEYGALNDLLRGEYKPSEAEGTGGMFVLDVQETQTPDGFVYALENVSGLKTALSKERSNAAKYKKVADAVSDLDIDQARTAMAELEKLKQEDPDGKAKARFESLQKQLEDKWGKQLKEKDDRLGFLYERLNSSLIDNAAIRAVTENSGSPDLLLPHIRKMTRVVEDSGEMKVEVIDDSGNVRISNKPGSTAPMSISELVGEMKTHQVFSRAFDGASASGSGASGRISSSGGTRTFVLSSADAKDPAKYRAAKAEAETAGVRLEIQN